MKNIIITAYSIVAALIGAGFASGQEILCYFVRFNRYGIFGLITSVIIFGLFVFSVLYFCNKRNVIVYQDFLGIFKSSHTKRLINIISVIFSMAVYSAMLSALASLITEYIPIPEALVGLIAAATAAAVFIWGTDKVFALNGIIGVVLVFFMIYATMYMLSWREIHVFSAIGVSAANDGALYAGYNLVTLIPVLVALSKRLNTNSDIISVTLTTVFISAILMGLVFILLSIYNHRINLGELPMLTLAQRQNAGFGIFYSVILSMAIITTLLSSGGAVIESLKLKGKKLHISVISILAYALSGFGFTNLINILYRVCGIIGIVVCGVTIYAIWRTLFRHNNI